MTPLSQEILEHYQVRKTKAQKEKFIALLAERGVPFHVERNKKNENLIVGNVATAKVVVTAHYDTCSVLPFPNFITPKNIPVFILSNIALCAVFGLVWWLVQKIVCQLTGLFVLSLLVNVALLCGAFGWIYHGKANQHTANDNTSGVIGVLEIMASLEEKHRTQVAFVLFDNEESGLLGSRFFLKKHSAQLAGKLLLNMDCISDGDYILVVENKGARACFGSLVAESFVSTAEKTVVYSDTATAIYPSDQWGFPCSVAVATLKKGKIVGYYMDKIHTRHDVEFDQENISFVRDAVLRLVGNLAERHQGAVAK